MADWLGRQLPEFPDCGHKGRIGLPIGLQAGQEISRKRQDRKFKAFLRSRSDQGRQRLGCKRHSLFLLPPETGGIDRPAGQAGQHIALFRDFGGKSPIINQEACTVEKQ